MKYVIKRNGTKMPFDIRKIKNAIQKAFLSLDYHVNDSVIEDIINSITIWDDINVEDIQDQVEEVLMDFDFPNVAKEYILYRERHKNIRNFINKKLQFINNYANSDNTANATIDDNSNVSNHNIAVLNSEIHKEDNQLINFKMLENKVRELYPDFDYTQMMKDFNTIAYLHDSSSQIGMPYCVAISLYPFLLNGLQTMGGLSAKPKNIDSFCGMFVNLVFAVAGQFKGAVATPGLLLCMDWYLRKEWGDNYYQKSDIIISSEHCLRQQTIEGQIHQYFQQICYTLMQPSGSRGNQACFWNLSIFDKPFFDTMYGDFYFPDNTKPIWESVNWLQKNFLHWLNQERLKCILTFPVVSVCLIYQNGEFVDKELYEYACKEYSEGNSFFTYISDSADSLSSCCRLSSKLSKPQFNFTNGQLSEMTGSKNVITLNINRIVQDWYNSYCKEDIDSNLYVWAEENYDSLVEYLNTILERIYKYQVAYNSLLVELKDSGLLSVYDAGFIDMKKQYLTIGINGLNQAWEFLNGKCNYNKHYRQFCNLIFSTIKKQNQLHKTKDLMYNTELTPQNHVVSKPFLIDLELLIKLGQQGASKNFYKFCAA